MKIYVEMKRTDDRCVFAEKMEFIPRVGEFVTLRSGRYIVEKVEHSVYGVEPNLGHDVTLTVRFAIS